MLGRNNYWSACRVEADNRPDMAQALLGPLGMEEGQECEMWVAEGKDW